jgi:hypothetical protein
LESLNLAPLPRGFLFPPLALPGRRPNLLWCALCITGSGPAPGAGGRETGRAPACTRKGAADVLPIFHLSTTHQQVPTGIETDVQSLRSAWRATLNVKCPHCGEVHQISVRETYTNGAPKRPISLGHLGGPVKLPHLKDHRRQGLEAQLPEVDSSPVLPRGARFCYPWRYQCECLKRLKSRRSGPTIVREQGC